MRRMFKQALDDCLTVLEREPENSKVCAAHAPAAARLRART